MKTGCIYRIYNVRSGKSYVGQTIDFDKRLRSHFGGRRKSLVNSAIKKYGKDNFKVEILEGNVPEHLLDKLEILNIRVWNCKAPNGYNLSDGGGGQRGHSPSPEHRLKISESLKGRPAPNKGQPLSAEHRRAISEANKGRTRSLENPFQNE